MCGSRTRVSSQILKENQKLLFVHCFGHALNLSDSDMVKNIRFQKDVSDTTYEISNLIKKPPKRDQMLNKKRNDLAISYPRFCVLCPKKCTVRVESLKCVLDNWKAFGRYFLKNLDPEMTEPIISVKTQLKIYRYS